MLKRKCGNSSWYNSKPERLKRLKTADDSDDEMNCGGEGASVEVGDSFVAKGDNFWAKGLI